MKKITVFGSLAFDRVMTFPDRFEQHLLPDQLDNINVCFLVDNVKEHFGGTAGNIAYALRLMGESPTISATIGSDNHKYFSWLAENDISADAIKIILEELTAGAYITTDTNNNQITCFNPGAMKFSSELNFDSLSPENSLLLISPGNAGDMINYPKLCKQKNIDYIFDPGQQLPVLSPEDLMEVITDAFLLIVNDYEFNLICEKTGQTKEQTLKLAKATIITNGENGSTVYEGEKVTTIPTCTAAKVVDPTGAGDSYRGGLISGLLRGETLTASALLGSVCASFSVECSGTQEYSFTRDDFLNRQKNVA